MTFFPPFLSWNVSHSFCLFVLFGSDLAQLSIVEVFFFFFISLLILQLKEKCIFACFKVRVGMLPAWISARISERTIYVSDITLRYLQLDTFDPLQREGWRGTFHLSNTGFKTLVLCYKSCPWLFCLWICGFSCKPLTNCPQPTQPLFPNDHVEWLLKPHAIVTMNSDLSAEWLVGTRLNTTRRPVGQLIPLVHLRRLADSCGQEPITGPFVWLYLRLAREQRQGNDRVPAHVSCCRCRLHYAKYFRREKPRRLSSLAKTHVNPFCPCTWVLNREKSNWAEIGPPVPT